MKGYYNIITYGCQMNVHESEKIAGILQQLGYAFCEDTLKCNVIIFNTCCIRENAEHRAHGNIGALKKYKKQNPHVIIGVCGCMTQQDGAGEKLKQKFPFIDIILGTHNLDNLSIAILQKENSGNYYFNTTQNDNYSKNVIPIHRTSGVNAWVNIIYGCNNFCNYCIVPYVRGREQSRSFDDIVKEVSSLLDSGYKEITLLGQNVNSYGNDLGEKHYFSKLLKKLAVLDTKYRLKFMTSHPKDLSDDVIDTICLYDNISNSIHLPVQSGSNKILSSMNRKYTREHYLSLIKTIKSKIPTCGITSDIMVGFPGETEEDFLQTLDLIDKSQFTSAFTFIYSKRNGTVACNMDNQIDENVKSERISRLIAMQNEITARQSKECIGKNFEVLFEGKADKIGYYSGRTDCGRLVYCKFDSDSIVGKFVNVKIVSSGLSSLTGEVNI